MPMVDGHPRVVYWKTWDSPDPTRKNPDVIVVETSDPQAPEARTQYRLNFGADDKPIPVFDAFGNPQQLIMHHEKGVGELYEELRLKTQPENVREDAAVKNRLADAMRRDEGEKLMARALIEFTLKRVDDLKSQHDVVPQIVEFSPPVMRASIADPGAGVSPLAQLASAAGDAVKDAASSLVQQAPQILTAASDFAKNYNAQNAAALAGLATKAKDGAAPLLPVVKEKLADAGAGAAGLVRAVVVTVQKAAAPLIASDTAPIIPPPATARPSRYSVLSPQPMGSTTALQASPAAPNAMTIAHVDMTNMPTISSHATLFSDDRNVLTKVAAGDSTPDLVRKAQAILEEKEGRKTGQLAGHKEGFYDGIRGAETIAALEADGEHVQPVRELQARGGPSSARHNALRVANNHKAPQFHGGAANGKWSHHRAAVLLGQANIQHHS
jgi:hypothetical protein